MKSAKRLNRKVVKSRLTKKRRQVGSGVKNYTVNYRYKDGSAHEFDITVDTENNTVSSNSMEVRVLEKKIPTKEQFETYVKNILSIIHYKDRQNAGLFVVKDPDEQVVTFYLLCDNNINIIKPDGANIEITFAFEKTNREFSVNGFYRTYVTSNSKEPTLIPNEKSTLSRQRPDAMRRKTSFTHTESPDQTLPQRPSRRSSSGSKRVSSSETNSRGVSVNLNHTLYATVKRNLASAPPLPPKKPQSYDKTGSIISHVK